MNLGTELILYFLVRLGTELVSPQKTIFNFKVELVSPMSRVKNYF